MCCCCVLTRSSLFCFFLLELLLRRAACRACQAERQFSLHPPLSLLQVKSFQLCFSLRYNHLHLHLKKKKKSMLLALVSFVASRRGTSKGGRDRKAAAAAAHAVLNIQSKCHTTRGRAGGRALSLVLFFFFFVVHSVSPILVAFYL